MGIWFNVDEQSLAWQDGYFAFRRASQTTPSPYSHRTQYASFVEWTRGFVYATNEAKANMRTAATLMGGVANGQG